jgi:predicted ATPase
LLETLREFATEQLIASGELDLVRARHAGFYLTLAERAEPHMTAAERRGWLLRLE